VRAPVAALLLALASLGCASPAQLSQAARPDYAVYSKVLDEVLAETARTAYLVRPETHGGSREMIAEALRRMPQASESLVEHFLERNETDEPLDPALFRARKPVLLTGDPELERVLRAHEGDAPLPPSIPAEGVLTFSRVGYSGDGSRAAVHAFFLCGARCGGGTVVVLERLGGRTWIALAKRQTVQY
jgi:hypothetical protein